MDIYEIRRKNLKAILNDRYDGMVVRLANILDMAPPQVHRWLSRNPDSRQNIHERSARNIERKLGLETGSLDKPPPCSIDVNNIQEPARIYPDPTTKKLHCQLESMTDEQRETLSAFLKSVKPNR